MKLTNRLIKGLSLLCIFAVSELNAQNSCSTNCSIQCIGQINVSLDQNCSTEITPAMGAVGVEYYCNPYYTVDLYDAYGYHLPSTTVGIDYHGETLTYKVTEIECGNSCWGTVYIEYKYPPLIDCPDDLTLACGAVNLLDVPPASGGCADFDVVLYNQTRYNYNCNDFYSSVVTRTYRAYDSYGNESFCSHDIYIRRLDIDEIIFPGPAVVSCNDTLMRFDHRGFPKPWYTIPLLGSGTGDGIPIICDPEVVDGLYCPTSLNNSAVPIIPSGGAVAIIENPDPGPDFIVEEISDDNNALLCNAFLTYTDVEIPNVPCKRKILRQWEVLEWWCNRELSGNSSQLISIVDDEAPQFYCPSDYTVSTDNECGGNVYISPITLYDGCYGTPQLMVQYGNGTLHSNGGYVDLNLGHNLLTYIVSDGCYNQSSCHVEVTVEDRQPPVAICETYKVVSLSSSAQSLVFAEPFDNGSWDECGLDRFEVRRMDTLCVAADTLFDGSVNFCCSDVGKITMVVFRAYDWNGNYNDCMIEVEVQDKIAPTLQCPPDKTIQCQDGYDINNLSLTFGDPVITDNCSNTQIVIETPVADVNQCGVGDITRFIDIIDKDSSILAHCKQLISIENYVPFVGTSIQWPLDYVTEDVCDITNIDPEDLPEFYDYPRFGSQDECTLLGYQYEDKVFQSANGCAHIKRTWNVINWCGSSNGSFDIWTIPKPQVIEIINTTAPVMDEADDQYYESQDISCGGDSIKIVRTATDDCQLLGWYYTLFDEAGDTIQYGLSNILETYLEVGNYTVEWIVKDGCGNFDVDYQNLSMINIKAPTPVCINGLSASLVAMDLDNDGELDAEMVELWASDFDSGSTYSCGNPITLSLSSDITIKNVVFDCEDIGRNEVQLWVTDLVTGYQDYCVSFVDIQDNNNEDICEDSLSMAVIGGDIYTEELVQISDVQVTLSDNIPVANTDATGHFGFGQMPIGGQYEIKPRKNDEFLNGVSTLDLILIQRHILGIEKIVSPYKLLAADINGDGDISSTDLIELRKLILGVYKNYPTNESWRFVDASYQFLDNLNPWSSSFPESVNIDYLNSELNADFIGLKVGDVNASADLRESSGISRVMAAENIFNFNIETIKLDKSKVNSIPIFASNYNNVLGWQIEFEYNVAKCVLIDIESAGLNIEDDKHVSMINNEDGKIRISYNQNLPESLSSEDVLFYINVLAYEEMSSNSVLRVSENSDMVSELYTEGGDISVLRLANTNLENSAKINSLMPNPWAENVKINYTLPVRGDVKWEFYDVSGRLIHQKEVFKEEGRHVLRLVKEDFNQKGIIYIRMITDYSSLEYKMLIIE